MFDAHAFEIVGGLISVLLLINGFFVAKLVSRIDSSNKLAVESSVKVDRLEAELKHIKEKVDELTNMYTRIIALEKQVAVFEFVLKTHPGMERN